MKYLYILPLLVTTAALSDPPVTITHESQWYFQGQPCGTQQQCKRVAVAAAQANPGVAEQVFPAPFDVVAQPINPGPCPNVGAMQPESSYSNGQPVFNDPCQKAQP